MSRKNEKKQHENTAVHDVHAVENGENIGTAEQTTSVGEETNHISVDELLQTIESLKQENARAKDSLLRKVAEMENMQKRIQREKVALFEDAKIDAFNDFLPIYDDLQRAIDAGSGHDATGGFFEGVKLVANKFDEVLKKHRIQPIDAVNVPFDVDLHDALLRQPAGNEDTPSNTVMQILERGYKMGDRIISHAKVIVSE